MSAQISGDVVLDEVIPARAPWSHVVRRGQTLRIIDPDGRHRKVAGDPVSPQLRLRLPIAA